MSGAPPQEAGGNRRRLTLVLLASVLYLALAAAGWLWLHARGRAGVVTENTIGAYGSLADVTLGVATGLALAGASWLASRRFGVFRRLEQELARLVGPLDRTEALMLALWSGASEEWFFRGAAQDALGVVTSALLFGALHFPGRALWLWPVLATVVGLGFGAIVSMGFGLLAMGIAHAVTNYLTLRRIART